MKQKNNDILPSCALCAHAVFQPSDTPSEKPPFLFALTANVMEEAQILCPFHKNADPAYHCHRYIFDPLKYRPHPMKEVGTLDKDSLLLD